MRFTKKDLGCRVSITCNRQDIAPAAKLDYVSKTGNTIKTNGKRFTYKAHLGFYQRIESQSIVINRFRAGSRYRCKTIYAARPAIDYKMAA